MSYRTNVRIDQYIQKYIWESGYFNMQLTMIRLENSKLTETHIFLSYLQHEIYWLKKRTNAEFFMFYLMSFKQESRKRAKNASVIYFHDISHVKLAGAPGL